MFKIHGTHLIKLKEQIHFYFTIEKKLFCFSFHIRSVNKRASQSISSNARSHIDI